MEKNVGKTDSIIRIILAVAIFYFMDSWNTGMQVIMFAVAMTLIVTALSRVCVLYIPFKFSTAKKKPKKTY